MPEYLYPGVYVEEVDPQVRPIAGVPLDDTAITAIAADLRRSIAAHAPKWTGSNESDPGVTLFELLAFLGESLRLRAPGAGARSVGSGVERPVYFAGRLLDAATLTSEQNYHREKRRRHNLALIGSGVMSGLGVSLEPAGPADFASPRVVVEPGYAVDPQGEEISVPCRVTLAPPHGDEAFVTIRFWERPLGQLAIEEVCVVGIAALVVPPALALARLVREEAGWTIDRAFAVARIRRE